LIFVKEGAIEGHEEDLKRAQERDGHRQEKTERGTRSGLNRNKDKKAREDTKGILRGHGLLFLETSVGYSDQNVGVRTRAYPLYHYIGSNTLRLYFGTRIAVSFCGRHFGLGTVSTE
jgi:hypothetical protein